MGSSYIVASVNAHRHPLLFEFLSFLALPCFARSTLVAPGGYACVSV